MHHKKFHHPYQFVWDAILLHDEPTALSLCGWNKTPSQNLSVISTEALHYYLCQSKCFKSVDTKDPRGCWKTAVWGAGRLQKRKEYNWTSIYAQKHHRAVYGVVCGIVCKLRRFWEGVWFHPQREPLVHHDVLRHPRQADNYRDIALLSVPNKVFSRVLIQRIQEGVEKQLREEQAGFRKGRSTTEHLFTLRNIIEQCTEWYAALFVNSYRSIPFLW